MMIYEPRSYHMSYTINIKHLKENISSLIDDTYNDFYFCLYDKRFIVLNSAIYVVNERENRCYLYTDITSYDEIFISMDRPKGIQFDKEHDDDNRIVYKTILLKLGIIKAFVKKKGKW